MSLAQDSSELARSMPKGESTGHRWWPWVAGIVAIGVGVSLLFPTARHQWALSVVRQPTPYTTLSFVHAVALPTAVPTEGEVSFSFTIANNEGRDMTYHYVVSSADRTANQATAILQRGTLHLPTGHKGTASAEVRPVCSTATCRVVVSLEGQSESIDFLVRNDAASSSAAG
jgi:hypothetical protein